MIVYDPQADELLLATLEYHGYKNIRYVNNQFCGIMRQIYTVAVFYGLDDQGNKGMIHFDTEENAEIFLAAWDGETMPLVGAKGCKAVK